MTAPLRLRNLRLDGNLMSSIIEQIERDALALPADKCAQLVDKLWESLGVEC